MPTTAMTPLQHSLQVQGHDECPIADLSTWYHMVALLACTPYIAMIPSPFDLHDEGRVCIGETIDELELRTPFFVNRVIGDRVPGLLVGAAATCAIPCHGGADAVQALAHDPYVQDAVRHVLCMFLDTTDPARYTTLEALVRVFVVCWEASRNRRRSGLGQARGGHPCLQGNAGGRGE